MDLVLYLLMSLPYSGYTLLGKIVVSTKKQISVESVLRMDSTFTYITTHISCVQYSFNQFSERKKQTLAQRRTTYMTEYVCYVAMCTF